MDTIDPNTINDTNENNHIKNILAIADLLPTSLKYLLIFASTAFVASAASYYINPTGLLCGVLAVLIFKRN